MILSKIVAGLLAIVWDVEAAFVSVNVTDATITRGLVGNTTCTPGSATAVLTGCGQSFSNAIVGLMINGVAVLNQMLIGVNLTGTARA